MKILFQIALRNVFRHRRRTLLSGITIGVGLMFFLNMDAMFSSLDRQAIDNMIDLSVSAVKVHTRAYLAHKDTLPLSDGLPDLDALETFLHRDARVVATAPRTTFFGQVSNGTEMIPVVATAIDPDRDPKVFKLPEHTQGEFFRGDTRYQVVLGKQLAKEIGVKPGEYITLYALTRDESHNADEFQVVGLLETPDPTINRTAVLMTFATANDFLDLDGLVTEVDVALERPARFEAYESQMRDVGKAVTRAFPNLGVETFADVGAAFFKMSQAKRGFGLTFMGVILLIAAIGVFNSVLMSVYERIREIGVLRAHGLRPWDITVMFLLEGALTGVAGGLAGVILGGGVVSYLVTRGIPIDKVVHSDMMEGMPVWGPIHGQFNPGSFLFAFCFGVVVAVLASWIPARRAGKLTVTQALRYT